jgi:hypothetical protein
MADYILNDDRDAKDILIELVLVYNYGHGKLNIL